MKCPYKTYGKPVHRKPSFFHISPKNIFYSNKTIQEAFTQQPLVKRQRKDALLNIGMNYFPPPTLIWKWWNFILDRWKSTRPIVITNYWVTPDSSERRMNIFILTRSLIVKSTMVFLLFYCNPRHFFTVAQALNGSDTELFFFFKVIFWIDSSRWQDWHFLLP